MGNPERQVPAQNARVSTLQTRYRWKGSSRSGFFQASQALPFLCTSIHGRCLHQVQTGDRTFDRTYSSGLKYTAMKIETYDRLSGVVIFISLVFTIIVAATSWKWFPTEGDWGHIAEIPPNIVNYAALLLPWLLILLYLLTRRLYFKKDF